MKLLEVLVVFCGLLPETRRYPDSGLTWSCLTLRQRFCRFCYLIYIFWLKNPISQSIQGFDIYCFFQSKTSLESASKTDPKARLTLSKPMTPSTSSSGWTASGRPRRRLRAQARRAGCRRGSPCRPTAAEERPWSRWSSRTASQTAAWTPASSAPTASAWSRRTLARAKSK